MEGIIILVIGIIIGAWLIVMYNRFISIIEAVKNSNKEIGIQLDRRSKVFDSLISTVKKYMEHEDSVLTRITQLRQQVQAASPNSQEVKNAQNELSEIIASGKLERSLTIAVENYPDLKANTNMLQLQEEIVSTENKLSFAKKAYNSSVEKYYVTKKSFPSLLLPTLFSSLNQDFEYWSLPEEQIKLEEAKRVSF